MARYDFRKFGGILPYMEIEGAVFHHGSVEVEVDADARPLLRLWAAKRGIRVKETANSIILEAPVRLKETSEAPPLTVARDEWNPDIAFRLSKVSAITRIIVSSQLVYNGPWVPEKIRDATRSGTYLVRLKVTGKDYFMVVRDGKVISAFMLGKELNEDQAERIIVSAARDPDTMVIIYRLETI